MTTPQNQATSDPLPCPFCGATPAILPDDPKTQGDAWAIVECLNPACPCNPKAEDGEEVADHRGPDAYKQVAIKRWNQRCLQNQPAPCEGDFVIVPVKPTLVMLEAAWAEATAEDAEGVWREMLKVGAKPLPDRNPLARGVEVTRYEISYKLEGDSDWRPWDVDGESLDKAKGSAGFLVNVMDAVETRIVEVSETRRVVDKKDGVRGGGGAYPNT